MKITMIQMDIHWQDVSYNIRYAMDAIKNAEKSDLYVLPEMFTTGFVTDPNGTSLCNADTALMMMKEMAVEMDAAIAGSVVVKENICKESSKEKDCEENNRSVNLKETRYYNRFYFVKPEGTVMYYDKRHLFTYGGESDNYTRGRQRCIVEWRGVRFLLQVCYDLRFPVFSRNVRPYYDCCLYVANWPESRRRVWDILLQARAIENQCYVIGVNRVGNDPACHYNGGTQAIDAYGRCMCLAIDNKDDAVTIEIDMEKLQTFRKKFAVLEDQDANLDK